MTRPRKFFYGKFMLKILFEILWKHVENHVIFYIKYYKNLSIFKKLGKIVKKVAVPIWGQWANTGRHSTPDIAGAGSTIDLCQMPKY